MNAPTFKSMAVVMTGLLLLPLCPLQAQSVKLASFLHNIPTVHYKFKFVTADTGDDGSSVSVKPHSRTFLAPHGRSGGSSSSSGGMQTFSSMLSGRSGESVSLSADIAAAKFSIEPAGGDTMFYLSVEYDPDIYSFPEVSHSSDDDHSSIDLRSELKNDDNDLDHRSEKNIWKVRIGNQFRWSINLELAYTETDLEFGGLQIEDLNVNSGFSETMLKFSEPNSMDMKKLYVETGLGSFKALNLGNGRIIDMSVENGLGASVLDYGQQLLRDGKVQVESGLGSVKFRLPQQMPVTMEVETSLGSTDLPQFRKLDDGIYQSSYFLTGVPALNADVSVGLGSVSVIWISAGDSSNK